MFRVPGLRIPLSLGLRPKDPLGTGGGAGCGDGARCCVRVVLPMQLNDSGGSRVSCCRVAGDGGRVFAGGCEFGSSTCVMSSVQKVQGLCSVTV